HGDRGGADGSGDRPLGGNRLLAIDVLGQLLDDLRAPAPPLALVRDAGAVQLLERIRQLAIGHERRVVRQSTGDGAAGAGVLHLAPVAARAGAGAGSAARARGAADASRSAARARGAGPTAGAGGAAATRRAAAARAAAAGRST